MIQTDTFPTFKMLKIIWYEEDIAVDNVERLQSEKEKEKEWKKRG